MKAALIGLGMVSQTYGDAFEKSRKVQLSHVFSRSIERRAAFLKAWPGLGAAEASSLDEIADSDADFVILATPPNARSESVARLVAAGKPILMEKPVERSLEAATRLVETCEAAGVPLGIVLQHRARPATRDLRAAIARLGTLYAVEMHVPWWRPQSYYDEPGRGSYDRDGGGVLISQAIHTLDLALSLTGTVAEVTAMCGTTGFHDMEAEDFVVAGLRFATGAVGQLFASTAVFPGRGEAIRLHYARGTACLEAGALRIDHQGGGSESIGQTVASGAGADPMAFTSDWHRFVIEDFAEALSKGRPPLVPGRAALEVHRLIAALERSGREGRRVSVKDI